MCVIRWPQFSFWQLIHIQTNRCTKLIVISWLAWVAADKVTEGGQECKVFDGLVGKWSTQVDILEWFLRRISQRLILVSTFLEMSSPPLGRR